MGTKVAINGFGRIGRMVLRSAIEHKVKGLDFVAVNDLTDAKTLTHLLKYDSSFGPLNEKVELKDNVIHVAGQKVKVLKSPINELPWKELGVEVVIESTGIFKSAKDANIHIERGAKKVIISAPAKDEDITIVLGVNEDKYDAASHHIISMASCTTNCLAPVVKVLHQNFGIVQGLMTTIHSYTNDQKILDMPHKDLRRARAAAVSMIPTTTGAAKAVGLVIPEMNGKINGLAVRIPTPNVSLVDFSVQLKKDVSKDDVNNAIKAAAADSNFKGILAYSEEPLVSVDFIKNPYSSIFDADSTYVIESNNGKGNMVKVLSWYDNEWGYSCRLVDAIKYIAKKGL